MAKVIKTTVKFGNELLVFIGTKADSDERAAWLESPKKRLVAGGPALRYEDGSSEYIIDTPIVELSGGNSIGAAIYTWDKTGNKIKCKRCLVQVSPDKKITQTVLRTVYRDYASH